jgi:hypothetical protein
MVSYFMSFQAQINSLEDQLPEEPGPDCLEPISILRFRMPDSEQITRRFLASSPLKVRLWSPYVSRACIAWSETFKHLKAWELC